MKASVEAPLPPVTLADIFRIASAIPFLERIQETLAACDQLLRVARDSEGNPRNARLMIQALELMGRMLQRASRIKEALADIKRRRNSCAR